MPPGNKPSQEPMLTQISVVIYHKELTRCEAIWRLLATKCKADHRQSCFHYPVQLLHRICGIILWYIGPDVIYGCVFLYMSHTSSGTCQVHWKYVRSRGYEQHFPLRTELSLQRHAAYAVNRTNDKCVRWVLFICWQDNLLIRVN